MRCRTIIKFRNSDDPNDLGFGRGIVQLLEGVEELGSINRATASMGMAIGAGMYWVGLFETVVLVIAQELLHRFPGGTAYQHFRCRSGKLPGAL